MAKNLHWLVVNHLFWSDFEQLDWCLWKQLICTKFQQFWGNWPSSFAPYSHIFMMIPNIMGHLPLTEHIKAFSICFQLLGQQFDFSVFCSNSLAYGIVDPGRSYVEKTTEFHQKTKQLFFKLIFQQDTPLWKFKKCYRQASINPNINFRWFFVVLI